MKVVLRQGKVCVHVEMVSLDLSYIAGIESGGWYLGQVGYEEYAMNRR